jgi:hypothetical protein
MVGLGFCGDEMRGLEWDGAFADSIAVGWPGGIGVVLLERRVLGSCRLGRWVN